MATVTKEIVTNESNTPYATEYRITASSQDEANEVIWRIQDNWNDDNNIWNQIWFHITIIN